MNVAAGNFDFIFWHLKLVTDNEGNQLRDRLDRFILDLKTDLQSTTTPLKPTIQQKLPAIFDLRLDALRILTSKQIDFADSYNKHVLPYFEQLKAVKNYTALAQNLKISLSLNWAVIESLNHKSDFLNQASNIKVPNVSFEQLQSTIYFTIPSYESATSFMDWIKCSLFIEYIAIAVYTIHEERLLVSQDKISELSNLLEETNFAYAALCAEFDIIQYPDKILNLPKFNPKGAAYFKRMLDEKNSIHQHLKNGGNLSDLKDKFNFVNPLSFTGQ